MTSDGFDINDEAERIAAEASRTENALAVTIYLGGDLLEAERLARVAAASGATAAEVLEMSTRSEHGDDFHAVAMMLATISRAVFEHVGIDPDQL